MQNANTIRSVFVGMRHLPGEHLLAKQLIERLPKEILKSKAAICPNGPGGCERLAGVARNSGGVAIGSQRCAVLFGILPFDEQRFDPSFGLEPNHGIGARGIRPASRRLCTLGPFAE